MRMRMEKSTPLHSRKTGFSSDDTPKKIVSAATCLFAKKGYDGTSTKEICETAGVNIAAVHYHFESKENLYCHIIQQFASTRLESARRTLQAPQSKEDMNVRLQLFLGESVEAMIKQPELLLIINREMEMASQRSEAVFRCTMIKHFETLVEFLTYSKKRDFSILR